MRPELEGFLDKEVNVRMTDATVVSGKLKRYYIYNEEITSIELEDNWSRVTWIPMSSIVYIRTLTNKGVEENNG